MCILMCSHVVCTHACNDEQSVYPPLPSLCPFLLFSLPPLFFSVSFTHPHPPGVVSTLQTLSHSTSSSIVGLWSALQWHWQRSTALTKTQTVFSTSHMHPKRCLGRPLSINPPNIPIVNLYTKLLLKHKTQTTNFHPNFLSLYTYYIYFCVS